MHLPEASAYEVVKKGSGKQEVATTMAFARLLKDLLRDKEFGMVRGDKELLYRFAEPDTLRR